ncbi:MAG: dephospho-CoA kinase [Planctomycetaceae bacterium]|nr:MAG: dephospho-CoA kinase [Planctomycetaceae bacterium]
MVVIGVCGLPAGGKSTVAKKLERLGAARVDADAIAQGVLEWPAVIDRVLRQFGAAVLGPDGKIDRPRLGEIVFGDDESAQIALRCLESIIHPETRAEIARQVELAWAESRPAVLLDIPLLFEGGWDVWCDEVWFVDTPRSLVVESARNRGWDLTTLDRRIARQMATAEKRRLSTRIIPNRGSLEDLNSQIQAWWSASIGPVSTAATGDSAPS